MKKLLIIIGIIACTLSAKAQNEKYILNFNTNEITADDSLIYDNKFYGWFGQYVTIVVKVKNTEADDTQVFLGGIDKEELRSDGLTGADGFGWLESTAHTIDPLVLDTAGTVLELNVSDSTYYQRKFGIEEFPWDIPAAYVIKNETDSADIYISFQMEKK